MSSEETAPKRPLTPYFMFLQKAREAKPGVTSREAGKMWANQTTKEKEALESEYRKKAGEYEKYLESKGIKPRAAKNYEEKLSPVGKGARDRFHAKKVRAVCGCSKKILPMNKAVYSALGRVMVILILVTCVGASAGRYWQVNRRRTQEKLGIYDHYGHCL